MGVPVKKAGKGKKGKAAQRPKLTAEEHYVEAQMAWISDEPEQAKASLKHALELEPENIKCLNMLGGLLSETGPREEAVAVLQKAVALQPDQGFEKYMYLGQLLEGEEAVASVRKGIELLRAKLQLLEAGQLPPGEVESDDELEEGEGEALLESSKELAKAELCSALCALSELLVAGAEGAGAGEGGGAAATAGVEGEVEQVLGEARQLCPESPEPLQALCNLRRQQEKPDEALQLLKQSMELWFKPPKSDEEGEEGKEDEEEDIEKSEGEESEGMELDDDEEERPSYEFRFETAKLLLELDPDTDAAIHVLEELVEENDQVPNVWLLLALALRGAGEFEAALSAVEEGMEVIKPAGLPADDELVISFGELKAELEQLIEAGEREEGGKGGGHGEEGGKHKE